MKATLQIALMLIFLLATAIGTLWVVSALDYEYQIAQRLEGAPSKPLVALEDDSLAIKEHWHVSSPRCPTGWQQELILPNQNYDPDRDGAFCYRFLPRPK